MTTDALTLAVDFTFDLYRNLGVWEKALEATQKVLSSGWGSAVAEHEFEWFAYRNQIGGVAFRADVIIRTGAYAFIHPPERVEA